jgi:hypothetical protein
MDLENDHKIKLDDIVNQASQAIQQRDNVILALQQQLGNVSVQSAETLAQNNQLISSMGQAGSQLEQQIEQQSQLISSMGQAGSELEGKVAQQSQLISSMGQAGSQLEGKLNEQGKLINVMGQAGSQLEGKLNEQQQRYQQLGNFTQHILNMGKSMEQFYSNILQTNQVEYTQALNSIQHELFETKQIQWEQMSKNQQLMLQNLHQQTSQRNPQHQLLLTDESNNKPLVNHNALQSIAGDLQAIRETERENLSDHQKEMLRTLFTMYKQFTTPKITTHFSKPLAIKHKKGDHEKPLAEITQKDRKRGKNPSRALIPTGSTRS